ncbi:MAG TPA: trypsin-like peptidase domain-containing protein [Longimicrobiaceae bacterium]
MLDPVRAKLRIIGFTAVAFFGGVLIASGMEWTAGSQAATLFQDPPARSETRPVAELSEAFVAIAEAVTPAVVSIHTQTSVQLSEQRERIPEGLREFFPFPPDEEMFQEGGGTGFIISEDGYVMTNNHVVEGAERITVTLNDRSVHDAHVVGRDPTTDVAVIKLDGSGYPAVQLGDPNKTRVGEWVLAVGNPLGLDFTVTAGIVSAKGRPLNILRRNIDDDQLSGYAVESFIQTDAAINPGNSGGPLVNIDGQVIGINSAIASQTGLNVGYGFAVPIDLARRVADDLIRYGSVRRPILGVRIADIDALDAEYLGLPSVGGVIVQDFSQEDSPAEAAGVRPNDVIVKVDGEPVSQVNELQAKILNRRPGEVVQLEVLRNGERQRFEVRLAEAPTSAGMTRAEPTTPRGTVSGMGRLGISVAPSSPQLAQELNCGRMVDPDRGLLVTDFVPGSPAARRIGLCARILEVDGKAVTTPQELASEIESKRPGQIIGLTLLTPDGSRALATVRIPSANGSSR